MCKKFYVIQNISNYSFAKSNNFIIKSKLIINLFT